ncbi:DUF2807 domain-containing protein [Chitinophaga horti]|uniref:DUF2807 domain-containing protein n=1 Tax=Chitinophaga horti TaxID=2920382 RepID=A0ABY6J7K3_9BACT|nr:head GIN domain-containing protein [Chitinophaga horti]UYQ94274.1 DUF2807 domain-containing protein [Chitinophaga horti]
MKTREALYYWIPFALMALFFSSFKQGREKVNGNGNVKKENRSHDSFSGIATSGNYKVYIKQGNSYSVQIEAEDNLLPYIETKVEGNSLGIGTKRGFNIHPTKQINVYITLKELKELAASGKGGFYSEGQLRSNKLEVAFSGSLETDLDVETGSLEISNSGSGKMKFRGKADKTEIAISGSCAVEAEGLSTNNTEIAISGSGDVRIRAEKKLDVAISGAGNVTYTGNAAVSQHVSGRGTIKKG